MFVNILYILYILSNLIYINVYLKKSFDINLKYFIGFLLSVCLFDFFANIVVDVLHYETNLWIYNTLTLLEFNFLLFFIREIVIFNATKKYIISIVGVFNIIYLFSTIYYTIKGNYFLTYNDIASISGSVCITIAIFLFYKDFIYSDKILNFKKSLSFWIAAGLLVYYLGSIPTTLMINTMQRITKAEVHFLYNINYILVAVMYSIFILGALWSQKKEQ